MTLPQNRFRSPHYFRPFFLGVLVSTILIALGSGAIDHRASQQDRAALLETLTQETALFCARDLEGWGAHWYQSPNATKAYYGGDEIMQLAGWDAIHAYAIDYLAAHPGPISVPAANHDYTIDFLHSSVATVRYSYEGKQGRVQESRLLVHKGGRWRIVDMTTVKPR